MTDKIDRLDDFDAVIFDLGGVLIDIDLKATLSKFEALGLRSLPDRISQSHAGEGLLGRYECGLATTPDFIAYVRSQTDRKVTDAELIDAWNAMLGEMDARKIALVEKLKARMPVYLLSNTNELHKRHFDGMAAGYDSLSQLFDATFYSHELHLRKPDPEIYTRVLAECGLAAHKVLFLDDSELNLKAADALGISTILVSPQRSILDIFAGRL